MEIINKTCTPYIDTTLKFNRYSSNIAFEETFRLDQIADYINVEQGCFVDSTTNRTRKFFFIVEGSGLTYDLAWRRAKNVYWYLVDKKVSEDILSFRVRDPNKEEAEVTFLVVEEK